MIYFTTFILTLILSHIVRATPACGDISPPEELYNPTYADYADDQNTLPNLFCNVTWSSYYDNPNGDTNKVACNNGFHYPHFHNIPRFPYIGGAWNIKRGSRSCFSCWKLTDVKTRKAIFVTVINSAKSGTVISKEAFNALNGGKPGTCLEALAEKYTPYPCGLRK